MALTQHQIIAAAQIFVNAAFVLPNVTANLGITEIQAALQALDNAMNATLNTAVAVAGGNTLIVAALQQQMTNVAPKLTVQQQALLLIYWAQQAAGL